MLIATVLSTLVIVVFINYFCRKLQRRVEEEEARRREGASALLAARYESLVKQAAAGTTAHTVTTTLCSVPGKGETMTTTPRMATGDVAPAESETPPSPGPGDAEEDKEDKQDDPEVLSQGEGIQQQPSRGVASAPPAGSPQNRNCDPKVTASDPASSKWLEHKVVGLQSAARGFLLRSSMSQLRRERQAAAKRIQAWWRCRRSRSLDAAGDAFFSQYDSVLDAPAYRVYQTDESEVTWSADETDMLIEHSDDSGESETTAQQLKPQRSEESHLMFGDLMSVTGQSSPLKFADVMSSMKDAQGVVKFAEGTHCDLFRLHTSDGTCVLKVVNLEFIVKHWDTLYAEATISLELTKLRKKVDNHAEGFTNTKRIFCLYDRYPRELIQAWKDYTSWKRTDHQYGPDTLDTPQPYLVFCFANAGVPLTQVKLDTALQLRSILQQVALSLAVAETALQFEHRDLGLNHVLVEETTFQLFQFCIGGKSTFINSWGVRATVIDFAAARIKNADSGQIVFSNLSPSHPNESRTSNIYSIYKEIGTITKGNWAGYFPRTNVACLAHLTNQLHQVYQTKFSRLADRKEAEAWNEIHSWLLCLPEHESVCDFVKEKF